jgi:hypothetical protein
MPSRLAKSLMFLAVLGLIAALASQPPPMQDEMGATSMFVAIVAEQALPLPQPANPDEDRDTGYGMAESSFADAPIAPLPEARAPVSRR